MPWPWGQKNPVVGIRPKSPFGIANGPRSTTPTPADVPAVTKPRSGSDTPSLQQNAGSRAGSVLGHRRAQGSRSSRSRRNTNEESETSQWASADSSEQPGQQLQHQQSSMPPPTAVAAGINGDTVSPVNQQPPQLKPQRMSRPFGDMFALDSNFNFRLADGSGSDVDTLSPAPSSPGISVTRSQKAIMPPQLRNGSDGFPQRPRQIQEDEEDPTPESRDLRSNTAVSPAPSTASSNISTSKSREARLEAQVIKLKKLVAELKETNIRGPPTPISPPSVGEENSLEAHRVAQVVQVAYDQLKKRYDSLSELLKERTEEMNRMQTIQYSEIDEIRQASKKEKQTLIQQHACELENARLASLRQINELKKEVARGPDKLATTKERTRLLEAEVEEWKSREKTLLQNYERMMDEMRRKHDTDMSTTKKRFDEAEAEWEIKVEEMRRKFDAEREASRKEPSSRPFNFNPSAEIETLKANHEQQVNALKMSIKVLEGSRGVSLKDVDDQQGLYEKISELESSLASKVRALAGERKNAERLRTNIAELERSKAELWLQKDASEEKMKALIQDHKAKMTSEVSKREEMAKKYAEEHAQLLQAEEQKRAELLRKEQKKYEDSLAMELEKRDRVVRDFERRTQEMILTHEAEKSAMSSEHESVLRAMEDKLLADAVAAAVDYRKSLEVKESRHRELEASLAQMRRASLDDRATLEARHRDERLNFEKEKEALAGEYQAVVSRGEKTLENERKAFAEERSRWEAEKAKMTAEFGSRLEKEVIEIKSKNQAEVDALKGQIKSQKEDMERRVQNSIKESENRIRDVVESYRKKEEQWVKQQSDDKDAAMKFVRELQQQKEDEEKKKQNLLDRIAQVEVEKESLEGELATVKGNYERSVIAGRQLNEKLGTEKSRTKALEENVADLAEQLRKNQESISSSSTGLRSQLQEKEKAYNDLYSKRKRQIEDLELDIRNGDTKITMLEVELESVKKLLTEKDEAIQAARAGGVASEAEVRKKYEFEIAEKDTLIESLRRSQDEIGGKHEKKIEALLDTIGKLEETCNKTRARSNEDARLAETKLLEQQNLVTTWQSVANKRIEEMERLERSLEEMTTKSDTYKNDLKALKAEIKQLEKAHKSEIKNINKELKTANDERNDLRRTLASLKSGEAGSGNSGEGGSGGKSARKVAELERLNEQLVKEIDSYKAEVTNYMTDTHELDSRLKEYESNLRQLEDEAQRKDAELERLQKLSGRNSAKATNGGPSSSNSAAVNGYSGSSPAPEVSVNRLKRDLDDATKEIDRLREKIESYEVEYRILFSEHERLKSIGEGHITNGQMHQMIDSLEKELDRTKRAKRDIEMRLQSAELRLATTGSLFGQSQNQGTVRSQSSMSYVRPHGNIYEDDEGESR